MAQSQDLTNPVKPMAVTTFSRLVKETPHLSFSQTLYSILRSGNLEGKPDGVDISWLRNFDDNLILDAIENAIENDSLESKS